MTKSILLGTVALGMTVFASSAMAQSTTLVQRPPFKDRYDHYINGRFSKPSSGEYFDNVSPVDGKVFTQAARGNAEDIDRAIDAAWAAFPSWSKTSVQQRRTNIT